MKPWQRFIIEQSFQPEVKIFRTTSEMEKVLRPIMIGPGIFLGKNYDDNTSFLTESCGNWIKFVFQTLITSCNLPHLNFFASDEAVAHPSDIDNTLASLDHLLKSLENDPTKIAHLMGYREIDISHMNIPIEEYSFDANLDRPGMRIEYLLYFSLESKKILQKAARSNMSVVNMNLTW